MTMDSPAYLKRRCVILAAGGTGGHLFPAQALAEILNARRFDVHLMTDERVRDYGQVFPALATHEISSSTLTPRRPWALPGQALKLWNGYRKAAGIIREMEIKPVAMVGFGGYPSLPPMLAAIFSSIPSILHEQNAVMGRANRLLAGHCRAIASSFPSIVNLNEKTKGKVTFTGNPVRAKVLLEMNRDYAAPADDGPFNLLVFGGSQGARYFSELMPRVIGELPEAVRRKLVLVQQCRPEDLDQAKTSYQALGVQVELASFFPDMPQRIAQAHLVICRSGASSVAELAVIGRPSILVPLPHSLDNDQLRNAESLNKAGGCWIFQQDGLDAGALAGFITRLRFGADDLIHAADAAKRFGQPQAAEQLADLVERVAMGDEN